jgi:sugar lactone lactonase YvrE
VASARAGAVLVDIAGRGCRYSPHGQALAHWDFETEPASLAPLLGGGLVLAMRDGLWRFDTAQRRARRSRSRRTTPRWNASTTASAIRAAASGSARSTSRASRLAALYCWDGKSLQRKADGITTSNGLGWSPDGRTMYWSDTRAHLVYAFDYDVATASLSRRREFARFAPKAPQQDLDTYGGRPDGAAVDAEGCYWVRCSRAAAAAPVAAGDVLREVVVPARCPTMPSFGDADLRTLYITTAREQPPCGRAGRHAARRLRAQPARGLCRDCRCTWRRDATAWPGRLVVSRPGLPVYNPEALPKPTVILRRETELGDPQAPKSHEPHSAALQTRWRNRLSNP